jgi:hypothetical protein
MPNTQPPQENSISDEVAHILLNFASEGATGRPEAIGAVRRALAEPVPAHEKVWLEFILASELQTAGQPGQAIPVLIGAFPRVTPELQENFAGLLMRCCGLSVLSMLQGAEVQERESLGIYNEAMRLLDVSGQYSTYVKDTPLLAGHHQLRGQVLAWMWMNRFLIYGTDDNNLASASVNEWRRAIDLADDKLPILVAYLDKIGWFLNSGQERTRVAGEILKLDPGNVEAVKYLSSAAQHAPLNRSRQRRSIWPWILGGAAAVSVVGIGLMIVVFAIASLSNVNNMNNANSVNRNANTRANLPSANSRNLNRNTNVNANTNSNTTNANPNLSVNTNPTTNLPAPVTDDFSVQRWGTGASQLGNTWYQNNEYHMSAIKGGYIVMYGPDNKEYSTENATVRVGLRSIDGNPPNTGYGLVVHGEKKEGKLEDYSFLISNGNEPKYKIVQHTAGAETNLVGWTFSNIIRAGTNPNQIEVRIRDEKLDFYINGQFVTSISDSAGYLRGRVGFYTSDVSEVAFDDLEIIR